MGSAFTCPVTGEDFFETTEPLLNGDVVDCPHCKEEHVIQGSFRLSMINRFGLDHARKRRFKFVRSDRGAIEYVASSRTPPGEFQEDGDKVYAYSMGDLVFWRSRAKMRDKALLAHELTHVRQARKFGTFKFLMKYRIEEWRRGYLKNKYERQAFRAEARARRR